ncbi:hypothetical protein HYV81_05700 [Candidatus Woesearchaeota archaeon]|nr:hypothetical protein [Candidatus Woesearchaeota archaeon]
MRSGYFEGVLQLRNPTQELVDFVRNRVEKDAKAVIAKEEPVPGGIDLFLSSQHYLQNLGKVLKKQFPGELKVSRRMFSTSHLTSRHIYRVTVMFKLSQIKKGQQVTYRGKRYQVTALGKKVMLRDTETGKRISVNFKEIRP